MAPVSIPAHILVCLCTLWFDAVALATGLLFARFSMAKLSLIFSEAILISPYRDGKSIQFRLANQRILS